MKKMKLALEYQCFPVWLYDENENFIDNDLPNEIKGDIEIDPLCIDLQEQFDSLYKNNETEFKYVGFESSCIKNEFSKKLNQILNTLYQKVGNYYEIENNINVDNL